MLNQVVKRGKKSDYKLYNKEVPGDRVQLDVLNTSISTTAYTTDWGTEFFKCDFQYELREHIIKFRPIKPKTPHLNGKVERREQTDKNEFWSLLDLSDKTLDLNALAIEWQNFYNKNSLHSFLKWRTPFQQLKEVQKLIPIQSDVTKKFW